jgi:hypothetical protein
MMSSSMSLLPIIIGCGTCLCACAYDAVDRAAAGGACLLIICVVVICCCVARRRSDDSDDDEDVFGTSPQEMQSAYFDDDPAIKASRTHACGSARARAR